MTTLHARTTKACNSNHFIDNVRDALMRGGRLTKWKGKVASIAPLMGADLGNTIVEAVSAALPSRITGLARLSGGASAVALGAVMMIGGAGQAVAGTCAETGVGSGVWLCSGPAGADTTQSISSAGPITISTAPGFGIATTSGSALDARVTSGAGNLTVLDNNASTIEGALNGIYAYNFGTGSTSVTTTGTVTGIGTYGYGLRVTNSRTTADLTINANASTVRGRTGIYARNNGTGALSVSSTGLVLGGIRARNYGTEGTTITSNNTSEGATGITAYNIGGGGALSVTSTGTASGLQYGLKVITLRGTDLTITANNSLGGYFGVVATNRGTDAMTVTLTGTTSGTLSDGIFAFNYGTDMTIVAADVSGGSMGITGYNRGRGALSITTTGTVAGSARTGIYSTNRGTSLAITTYGTVTGGQDGIQGRNLGSGGLTISANADVTGERGMGIRAFNSANDTTASMLINQAAVTTTTGAINGIDADNAGGSLTINALGTSIGTTGSGIYAVNQSTATDLTITSAVAMGALSGIQAANRGSGAIHITATGQAMGTYNISYGIRADNYGTDVTIASADASGGRDGIFARNFGIGAIHITTTGKTIGETRYGVFAYNRRAGTDLTIASADASGSRNGIIAINYGTGATSVTTTGTTTATNGTGILALNSGNGTSLSITTGGTTTGSDDGINARNSGTAGLTITANADVTGERGIGIRAYNSSNDLSSSTVINQAAGTTTTGGIDGINGVNNAGSLTINAYGTSVGTTGNGITGRNNLGAGPNFGTDLTINSTVAQGAIYGIEARNFGSGSLGITSIGTATGTSWMGIYGRNYGMDLSIAAADTSGGLHGIGALNRGSGSLEITSIGTATGTTGSGINVFNGGTSLSVEAYEAQGGYTGIFAFNYGSEDLSIIANGPVTGDSHNGIFARNDGTDLSVIATDSTTGGQNGIRAWNRGSGTLEIATTGTTTGKLGDGIYVRNQGTSLTITADGTVSGGQSGISARNFGTEGLTITANGDVTGLSGMGISSYNSAYHATSSTEINQAVGTTTTGFIDGINAVNNAGSLTINALGTSVGITGNGITGRHNSDYGPYRGTNMTITSNVAQGANSGIEARNYGSGSTTITSTGTATGDGFAGIFAYAGFSGTGLTISAVDVSGETNGIFAQNSGDGAMSITATGTVVGQMLPSSTSRGYGGIYAEQWGYGGLTIDVVAVSGAGNGIFAQSNSGISLIARGDIIGEAYHGIVAENNRAGDLTIDVANVRGGVYGIVAVNDGAGNTSITTSGRVIGEGPGLPDGDTIGGRFQDQGADGIRARNHEAGNMAITIAEGSSVEGFLDGIRADSQRRIGSDYNGVPYNQTGDMIIDVLGSVSGGRDGIRVGQQGDGDFTVTISGSVYGRENGLHNSYVEFYEYRPTYTRGGTFIITETGVLTGGLDGSGVAFRDSARDLEITVNDPSSHLNVFGALNGDAVMGEGSDMITISGPAASLGSPVTFNGDGDGITPYNEYAYSRGYRFKEPDFTTNQTDRLTFSNWSGSDEAGRSDVTITDIDGSQIVNMEEVFLTEGADVTFADAISPGWGMSNLSVNDLLFEVQDGSIARFVDDFTVFGNVNNFGALDLSAPNLTVGTALTITGNYAAASDLFLDVFLNDGGPDNVAANDAFFTDQVFIAGNVSGVTHVFVNNLGGAGAITDLNRNGLVDANEGILIVQVAGATPLDTMTDSVALAEHFVLGSAANTFVSTLTNRTNVSVGAFAYDIYAIGADATGNVNGTMDYVLANTLNFSPVSPVYEAYPSFLLDQIGMPRLQERVGNRHWARPAAEPQVAAAEPVYVFCKDPAQNFRCAVTPEQAQVYADPIFGSVGTDTATVIEGQGLWLRADGALSRYTPVASTIGAGYKAHSAGIQVGYDHVLMETETGGRLIGGVNVSYRRSGADVTSDVGLGEIATAGYGLGASLTWYAENGFYIDAQAQAVWLDSDLSADGLGRFAAGHKTEGYGVSVEMGKEIALSDTWAITPQAQVSYANVQENGVTDSLGSMVSFKAESLKLRVGVELSNEKTWEAEDGTTSRRSLRAGAHVIHEFKPETKVMVAGTPLLSKRDATTAEITLGGTYNWSDDRNSFYAQIGASTGLGNFGDSHRVRGTVGFRRQWE